VCACERDAFWLNLKQRLHCYGAIANQLNWQWLRPLRKLFTPPGVPSWLRASSQPFCTRDREYSMTVVILQQKEPSQVQTGNFISAVEKIFVVPPNVVVSRKICFEDIIKTKSCPPKNVFPPQTLKPGYGPEPSDTAAACLCPLRLAWKFRGPIPTDPRIMGWRPLVL